MVIPLGSERTQNQEYVKVGSKSQAWDHRLAGRALVSGSLVPCGPSGMASSQARLPAAKRVTTTN